MIQQASARGEQDSEQAEQANNSEQAEQANNAQPAQSEVRAVFPRLCASAVETEVERLPVVEYFVTV